MCYKKQIPPPNAPNVNGFLTPGDEILHEKEIKFADITLIIIGCNLLLVPNYGVGNRV